MSADIAELSNKAEDHVELLVEGSLSDLLAFFVNGKVLHCRGGEHLFRDLRKLGDEEENGDGHTGARDGEVDELHIDQVVGVLASKEELGCDQGSNE